MANFEIMVFMDKEKGRTTKKMLSFIEKFRNNQLDCSQDNCGEFDRATPLRLRGKSFCVPAKTLTERDMAVFGVVTRTGKWHDAYDLERDSDMWDIKKDSLLKIHQAHDCNAFFLNCHS